VGCGQDGGRTYGTDVCEGPEVEDVLDGGFGGVGGGWAVECWGGHGGSIGSGHARPEGWKV